MLERYRNAELQYGEVALVETNVRIGQKLKTTTGEYVTIKSLSEESMDIVFHDKVYTRLRSIIGQTLFVLDEDFENEKSATISQNVECPTWIWNEEADQLDWLHNEINEKIDESRERIETQRKEIDSGAYEEQDSNIVIATANKKISELRTEVNNYQEFVNKPYVAHLALASDNSETINLYLTERHEPPIETLNDGSIVVSLSGEGELVLQIVSNYYNSLEKVSFNGITYNYDFFRSIVINDSILEKVFPLLQIKGEDEHYSEKLKQITDMFLLEVLNSRRNEKNMPSIIASIQKHQYAIISEPGHSNYIVNGCAGSGKTAIMLHRLHFLKIRKKDINWEKVTIISPS